MNPAKTLEITLKPGDIIFVPQSGFYRFTWYMSQSESLCRAGHAGGRERSAMKSMRELAPYEEPPRGPMRGAAAEANPIRRMPAVNPEQTFFHFDLLRALEMHRGLALGIFLTALVLSGAYLARRWHTYKAESLVYVQLDAATAGQLTATGKLALRRKYLRVVHPAADS